LTDSQRTAAILLDGKESTTGLLAPATRDEVRAVPDDYQAVVDEIVEGILRSTGLQAIPSSNLGWIRVPCSGEEMAIWLMRAVIVENVLVRREGDSLFLPANSQFRTNERSKRVVATFTHAYRLWNIHCRLKR
jgi:sirohydrochlorin cobaltochelatase